MILSMFIFQFGTLTPIRKCFMWHLSPKICFFQMRITSCHAFQEDFLKETKINQHALQVNLLSIFLKRQHSLYKIVLGALRGFNNNPLII